MARIGISKSASLIILITLYSCSSEDHSFNINLASKTAPILNGTLDPGHPAVGTLIDSEGGLCTATLIGAKTVITAAHCIKSDDPSYPALNYTFSVEGGSFLAASVQKYPLFIPDPVLANDIAVIILEEAPTSIPPAFIGTTNLDKGQELTLVGFGSTGESSHDGGVKRIAHNEIQVSFPTRFSITGGFKSQEGNTCYGDSGSPAFIMYGGKEVQVGVTSGGQKPCGTRSYYTRIDAYLDWLEKVSDGDLNRIDPKQPSSDKRPIVTIDTPVNGSLILKGDITVSASISDDEGVIKAELLKDNNPVATVTSPPWEFGINLEARTSAYTLKVVGYDADEQQGSQEIEVTVIDPNKEKYLQSGLFGAYCNGPAECESRMCVQDPSSESKYCTTPCDFKEPCPLGTDCIEMADQVTVCSPPIHSLPGANSITQDAPELIGGCSVTPRSIDQYFPFMLLPLISMAIIGLWKLTKKNRL